MKGDSHTFLSLSLSSALYFLHSSPHSSIPPLFRLLYPHCYLHSVTLTLKAHPTLILFPFPYHLPQPFAYLFFFLLFFDFLRALFSFYACRVFILLSSFYECPSATRFFTFLSVLFSLFISPFLASSN